MSILALFPPVKDIKKVKLLLHICCAPCLIYPLERLKDRGFETSGFFYNPNIHPFTEYNNRRQAVIDFSKANEIDLILPEYIPAQFFHEINLREDKPERCSICWSIRLRITAKFAKEKGFAYFSTTLLVSPYQDQQLLKEIGEDIAEEGEIKFYYEDFRIGFKKARDNARAQGMYCQKYCGCIYSEMERYKKRG